MSLLRRLRALLRPAPRTDWHYRIDTRAVPYGTDLDRDAVLDVLVQIGRRRGDDGLTERTTS